MLLFKQVAFRILSNNFDVLSIDLFIVTRSDIVPLDPEMSCSSKS